MTEKAGNFKSSFTRWIRYFGKRYWAAILAVMLTAALSAICYVCGPKVLGGVVTEMADGLMNRAAGDRGMDFARVANRLLFALGLYLCSYVLSLVWNMILTQITHKISFRLRGDFSRKLHKLPLKYFESRPREEILAVLYNDVDALGQGLRGAAQLLAGTVTIIGTLLMLLSISRLMTLLVLALLPLSALLLSPLSALAGRCCSRLKEGQAALDCQMAKARRWQTLDSFGGEDEMFHAFEDANERLYRSVKRAQFVSGLMRPLLRFVSCLGYIGAVVFGGILAIHRVIPIGGILACILYVNHFMEPMARLTRTASRLREMEAASERLFAFLDEDEEQEDETKAFVQWKSLGGCVEFTHVKFGYDPKTLAIRDVSAAVIPGQRIAIVGPKGAGKTTFVKLLMRFYDVTSGSILLDGRELKEYRSAQLRSAFGLVSEDAWLSADSILENIRYGRPEASDEEVIAAAKAARVHHMIQTLPGGYQTCLPEAADGLHPGFRQLLVVARAILADHRILILDEALSFVDSRTEQLLTETLQERMRGRTSFLITHRLSNVKNADLILVMEDGNLVEQGRHEELISRGGVYAGLYRLQFEHGEPEKVT